MHRCLARVQARQDYRKALVIMLLASFESIAGSSHKGAREERLVIRLPDDDPETVEGFLKLAYENAFKDEASLYRLCNSFRSTEKESHALLVLIYVLANKLGAEAQQNRVVDMIRVCCHYNHIQFECFDILTEAGLEKSKIFGLIVKQMGFEKWHEPGSDFMSYQEGFEDWIDMGGYAVRQPLRTMATGYGPRVSDEISPLREIPAALLCKWHSHKSTPSCVPMIDVPKFELVEDEADDSPVNEAPPPA